MSSKNKQSQLKNYHWKGINSSGKESIRADLSLNGIRGTRKAQRPAYPNKENQKEEHLSTDSFNAPS